MVVKMERQIMKDHKDSEELTNLLTQLEKQGVRQVGSIERTDDWRRLADSGLNKAPMDHENYSYGIVLLTLPSNDFHTTRLSHEAIVSKCYKDYGKGKDNVIDGQRYYGFVQDLSSRINLPIDWKFMLPEFIGFAMDNTWAGSTNSYYGKGGQFELCNSLSMAAADPDMREIKRSVCGGVLGKGSHFANVPGCWSKGACQHLSEGTILFPVYRPAIIGRMYPEGKIKTKREFVDSNENSKGIQESLVNINCLEVIAIYPDKKVLEGAKQFDSGLIRAFLTYHPDYQFRCSEAAEMYAYNSIMGLRKDK